MVLQQQKKGGGEGVFKPFPPKLVITQPFVLTQNFWFQLGTFELARDLALEDQPRHNIESGSSKPTWNFWIQIRKEPEDP